MVAGMPRARRRHARFNFLLVGDETRIDAPSSTSHRELRAGGHRSIHTDDVDRGDEKPSQALRRAKTTSMGLAINAVKDGARRRRVSARQHRRADGDGQARAAHHAGHRPAGARRAAADARRHTTSSCSTSAPTPSATRSNLVQFAVMGAAYARTVIGIDKPAGAAAQHRHRGNEGHRRAARKPPRCCARPTDLPLRFDGFTEGDKIVRGDVDVVVTDGFSGNIALKTAEGTARFVTDLLRRAFTSLAALEGRLPAVAPGDRPAQDPPRPQQPQRRGLPRPQRAGGEEPRQRQRQGRRQRHRGRRAAARATTSPASIGDDLAEFRAHAFAERQRGANDLPLGRHGHRLGAARRARSTNAELAEHGRHHRRVDRRAHRHPQPLHRRRGRDHRHARHRRRAPRRSTTAGHRRRPRST